MKKWESAIARAKANQWECYKLLTDIKEWANDLRETDLKLCIKDAASKHHITNESPLKAILWHKWEAEMYPILQTHVGRRVSSTLDKVWTPENTANLENTTWKAHVHAKAIWEALLSHGWEHFSQASNTPFATRPIAKILGPLEWNNASKQILNGTFDINSITSNVDIWDIVKAMAHYNPNNPMQASSQLTIPKIKTVFKFVKESTSSNWEGLHHGHWKSLIHNDDALEPFALMIMFAFHWVNHQNVGEFPPDLFTKRWT